MENEDKPLGVEALIGHALRHAGKALPRETHQSYPVPRRGEAPDVVFLYAVASVRPTAGLQMLPPDRLSVIDATTGELRRFEPLEPRQLGLADPPNAILGRYDMLRAVASPEEFLSLQARLYRDYDLVLPAFFADSPLGDEARGAALELESLFKRLTEEPLWPYYAKIGSTFWAWLAEAKLKD